MNMIRIDGFAGFFAHDVETMFTPEELAAPFSLEDARPVRAQQRPSPPKPRPAQSPKPERHATSAKRTTARKPERKPERERTEARGQDGQRSRSYTLTEQAVRARHEESRQHKEGGDGGGAAAAAAVPAAGAQNLDSLADQLVPMCANDGLFELLLPDGERLGVVVNNGPARVGILFSPGSGALGDQLRRHQMELKTMLAQRMGKEVMITVL